MRPAGWRDILVSVAIVATAVAMALCLCLLLPPGQPDEEAAPVTPRVSPVRPKPVPDASARTRTTVAAHTGPLHMKEMEPVHDLMVLERLMRHYAMGNDNQFPAGTNAEVTAALIRPDRHGIAALPADHPAINPDGELTDRWGRPYFFHALSSTRTEIRSAGPDGSLYTEDDLLWPDPASTGPVTRNASLLFR